jgi:CelD/BcsL family acetyltransferase involved in cellulose biosynthesis
MTRGGLKIHAITERENFLDLRDEWNRLADANGFYTPWFCWEWHDLCLRHDNPGMLHLLAVRHNGDLLAIAPFVIRFERYKGAVPARIVSFIGGNRSPLKWIVFGDTDEALKRETVILVLEYLRNSFHAWDVLELDPISDEALGGEKITAMLRHMGLSFRTYVSCVNRYCNVIDSSFERFIEDLPQSTLKDIRYCQRRLEKNGSLVFQIITGSDTIDPCLDVYDAIRARSWKAAEIEREFNRDFMHITATRGWLRMGILYYNEVPIAVQKWIVVDRKAYIYDVLYDEDYKKFSPGKILTSMMFQHAIENDQVTYIDYLRGDEPYKEDWTPVLRQRVGVIAYNRTLKGALLSFMAQRVVPLIKKAKGTFNKQEFYGKCK